MDGIKILDTYPVLSRALELDSIVGKNIRRSVLRLCLLLFVVFSLFGLALKYVANLSLPDNVRNITEIVSASQAWGISIIILGIFLFFLYIEFFYISNLMPSKVFSFGEKEYFLGVETGRMLAGSGAIAGNPFVFSDFFYIFSKTDYSRVLLTRLGIPAESFSAFMAIRREKEEIDSNGLFLRVFEILDKKGATIIQPSTILAALYELDESFKKFIFDLKVKKEDLVGASEWMEGAFDQETYRSRWWERDNLSKISALGKDLGYGYTYTLDQYSHDLGAGQMHYSRETRKREIQILEDALSRSYEANVLLVGEEGSGKHAILQGLAEKIIAGMVGPGVVARRLVVLDHSSMTAATRSKGAYEALMIKVLNEAILAGNIILIIENFASFIESGFQLGTDVMDVFEPYLKSGRLQLVGLSDMSSYHRNLEQNGKITKLFEKVDIEEPSDERLCTMLEDAALMVEASSRKIFTYQAIRKALSLADRFIQEGAMPEKAISLLESSASDAVASKILLYPEDIEAVVEKKTHIPTAKAVEEEKDKLLNMERLLHGRMINQEEAIGAVSDALRRARSGLKSQTRPIGAYLFLGPTGVGKTETAKALAEVYFGDEDAMFRFDMSEYSQEDGVEKLIGARESKTPGILASRLRERPFSLLLFDEFEKAARDVHNIFLSILDEGFFSDGAGKRVSARESMIIMTSNAGANMILDLISGGEDSESIKTAIIDEIRSKSIFTPELLNRFDAIVLYKPLQKAELVKVAMLMLMGLVKKMEEQEITFEPTEELASRIVEIGYDPIFGARPMRRAVADRVEQVIAKKILGGELKRGDTFSFSKEEVEGL